MSKYLDRLDAHAMWYVEGLDRSILYCPTAKWAIMRSPHDYCPFCGSDMYGGECELVEVGDIAGALEEIAIGERRRDQR